MGHAVYSENLRLERLSAGAKLTVKISRQLAEIRTKSLHKSSPQCCRYRNLQSGSIQIVEDNATGNDRSLSHTTMGVTWSLQFHHELYTKIQECTNKCTILKYKDVIIKTLGLRHVSTFSCGSFSMSVHQYLYKSGL